MIKTDQEAIIGALGSIIGFGNIMHLCEMIWRKRLGDATGGELTVGPCSSCLVRCPHPNSGPSNCEWCCGSGRITKRVLRAIEELNK